MRLIENFHVTNLAQMDFFVSDKTTVLIIGGCMEMPSYGNSSTDLYYRILKKQLGINVSLIQQSPNLIEDVIDKINKKNVDIVLYRMRGLHMCDACKPVRFLKGLGKPFEFLNYMIGLAIRRPSKVIEEELSRIELLRKYSRVIVVAPLSSRHFITRYLVKRFQRTFKKRSSIPIIGCDMDSDTFFVDGFHLSKKGHLALSKRIGDFLKVVKKEKVKTIRPL